MRIMKGDVIFQRNGTPAVVKDIDRETRKILLTDDLDEVQKLSARGVKNSLTESQRESYNLALNDVQSSDKNKEITELYESIQNLRSSKKADPKVLHYLENELMHRMHRENFVPENYQVDMDNLPQY